MLVKSFKVAFSSLEMAQRSILSMLQKTNHDKNRTGNPVQSDGGLTKSVEQTWPTQHNANIAFDRRLFPFSTLQ